MAMDVGLHVDVVVTEEVVSSSPAFGEYLALQGVWRHAATQGLLTPQAKPFQHQIWGLSCMEHWLRD